MEPADTPVLHSTEMARRLGLVLRDASLLERALTHPSYSAEHGGAHYERLEFLGDSVLGFVVADMLHGMFPDGSEGDLTKMKIALVRGGTLSAIALELGLDAAIRLGRGAERSGDRRRSSVLEAAFEAVVGAVYLDGGIDAARAFVFGAMGERGDRDALLSGAHDPKTRLQELMQARGDGLPSYSVVGESGPPQRPTFAAEVRAGQTVMGAGSGPSKQSAETAAALAALATLAASE